MNVTRIQREFATAESAFSMVELRPTTEGTVYVSMIALIEGAPCRLFAGIPSSHSRAL